jgi:uncharacterized membrane protein YfcA
MPQDYLILCLVAALAGAINAIAGGATLLTFPVLFAALGSTATAAVVANGTNTVALVPAALAALAAYRREIAQERYWATRLVGPSLVGGALGSLLVVMLPAESFKVAIPWLILGAASLFAAQPRISRYAGGGQPPRAAPSSRVLSGVIAFQFLVGLYGGYFGAGIGILMLAALAIVGMEDIHRMNAVKSLLGAVINGTSIVVFAASGNVDWSYASAMAVAAAAGGYVGAHTARRVNPALVRGVVVAIGFALAAYYFWREFAA